MNKETGNGPAPTMKTRSCRWLFSSVSWRMGLTLTKSLFGKRCAPNSLTLIYKGSWAFSSISFSI